MKANFQKQLLDYLIYLLITVLIVLVIYALFSYYIARVKYRVPQGNVLDVSPLTGENMKTVMLDSPIYKVSLSDSYTLDDPSALMDSDMIYESYSPLNQKLSFSYMVFNRKPVDNEYVENISTLSVENIDKFAFNTDTARLPVYYKGSAEIIFVEYTTEVSSSFIYKDGLYHRIKESSEHISNEPPLTAANIIIQIVKPEEGEGSSHLSGNVIICTAGKSTAGKWVKTHKESLTILDYSGNPVELSKGKSWWVLVEEGTNIIIK